MPDLLQVGLRIQKFRNVTGVPVPEPIAPIDLGGDNFQFTQTVDEDLLQSVVVPASGTFDLTPHIAHINTINFIYLEAPENFSLTLADVAVGVVGPRWLSMAPISGAPAVALSVTNDQNPTGQQAPADMTVRFYVAGRST